MDNRCKICGGTVIRKGNVITCEYCGNCWISDETDDLHAVERANAWQALRNSDFEKAAELFEVLAEKEPQNHELFWGKALAQNGIVYVTELNESKRVPTCNNITGRSFLNDPNVKKAMALAPADIAAAYRAQAEKIESIRAEWYEKASKEPAYDVFLSYKDSDAEHGVARTQDSVDAQDLYQALTAEGYRVFFSRVSLRDKVSEQYEPYIYNAIRTAKVMIVFGEKAEYFRAPWIKNEWGRFRSRIESGEKHKNSLVVAYKNMDPNDLPVVLKARQCLNAGDMTFLSDLLRHIRKVVEQSRDMVRLERIEITGGVKTQRATQIGANTIETHETGAAAAAETSIDERQMLNLIQTYIKAQKWDDAKSLLDELLFDNPTYAEAIWLSVLVRNEVSDSRDLFTGEPLNDEDFAYIEKALNCASKDFASELLRDLYKTVDICSDETYAKLLRVILPFNYVGRAVCITNAFKNVIQQGKDKSFQELLLTLKESAVDRYIALNTDFAHSANQKEMFEAEMDCWQRVLNVDGSNLEAHRGYLADLIETGASFTQFQQECESLLSYSQDVPQEVRDILDLLGRRMNRSEHAEMVLQTLKYYPGVLKDIQPQMLAAAFAMLRLGAFEKAEYLFRLILSEDKQNADAYWGLCLVRIRAKDETTIPRSDIELKSAPEFKKYLTLVDEKRRRQLITAVDRQTACILARKYALLANLISAGFEHSVGLNTDGTVVAIGHNYYGQCNVSGWNNIVSVAAGYWHTIGLKTDGTVVATGHNADGQCDVSGWKDIVAITGSISHTIGLRSDGRVVAAGKNGCHSCEVSDWQNIMAVAAGTSHTVGLKTDGTVTSIGYHLDSRCDVSKWRDIVAIAAGRDHTVGLTSGGMVVATGNNAERQCNVFDWKGITAIAAGRTHTIGLKADGTVVATGSNSNGECNVSEWRNIVAVAAGNDYTIGLKADGRVVATGASKYGQCNVSGWKLFDNADTIEAERKAIAEARESRLRAQEEERKKQIATLKEERERLQIQREQLKGLFAGIKRREIDTHLSVIEDKLKKLG